MVEAVDLVLQHIANASHVHRIAREEEWIAVLFGELVDEAVGGVGRSPDDSEVEFVELDFISVFDNPLDCWVCLHGKRNSENNVGVVATVYWDRGVLGKHFSHS